MKSEAKVQRRSTYVNVTLTLIQLAPKWMHWATLRRHSDLFWAATSTFSRVIPILNKSLLAIKTLGSGLGR